MLLISQVGGADPALDLPSQDQNIFARLVRDSVAIERQCSEIFCAVLLNAPALRDVIVHFLASRIGQSLNLQHDFEWRIRTETSIGRKRDDLRVEAWPVDGNRCSLLWSIEVKVGSSIHESGRWAGTLSEENVNPQQRVSQLINYDDWLARQDAAHRGGFLLVVRSRDYQLPKNLTQRWSTLSWTALGQCVEQAIAGGALPASDLFLARHFSAFIRMRLWEELEMSDNSLTFDDVALIRAVSSNWESCIEKASSLIRDLMPLIDQLDIGIGECKIEERLFGRLSRVCAWKYLSGDKFVWLGVGISGGMFSIWIESKPKYERKDAIYGLMQVAKAGLVERNAAWKMRAAGDDSYWDVWIEFGLERLLGAPDQAAFLASFVRERLQDLRISGVFEGLKRIDSEQA